MDQFKQIEKDNVFSNASTDNQYFKKYNQFNNQKNIIDGITYNPKLPTNFYDNPNQDRDLEELENWWDIAYIISNKNEKGLFYIVYCLDGGAWDRPTRIGTYNDFNEALEFAQERNNVNKIGINRYYSCKNGSVINNSGLFIASTGERTTAEISVNSFKRKNIEKAKYFVSSIMEKRTTINKSKGSSYTLKHRVEEFIYYYFKAADAYLTNGEFIIALYELDYEIKEFKDEYLGISSDIYTNYKTLKDFTKKLENDEYKMYCKEFLEILNKDSIN